MDSDEDNSSSLSAWLSHSSSPYSPILEDKSILIGTLDCARNAEQLGITHIVSAACERSSTNIIRTNVGSLSYLSIPVYDLPNVNILRYLPTVVKFIDNAISSNNQQENSQQTKNRVLIHCVFGQSRSCAICIAYLMYWYVQSYRCHHSREENNNLHFLNKIYSSLSDFRPSYLNSEATASNNSSLDNLFSECYDFVKKKRKCIAINPGFIQQLEIYRRMLISRKIPLEKLDHPKNLQYPHQSNSHALFRSFRIKSEQLCDGKDISNIRFHPRITNDFISLVTRQEDQNLTKFYQCKKCRYYLFSSSNIILFDQISSSFSHLPISSYWVADNRSYPIFSGCVEDISRDSNNTTNSNRVSSLSSVLIVEPMEWMKAQFSSRDVSTPFSTTGKLMCPSCSFKIGSFDLFNPSSISWSNTRPETEQQELPYVGIFISTSKVD